MWLLLAEITKTWQSQQPRALPRSRVQITALAFCQTTISPTIPTHAPSHAEVGGEERGSKVLKTPPPPTPTGQEPGAEQPNVLRPDVRPPGWEKCQDLAPQNKSPPPLVTTSSEQPRTLW